MYERLFSTGKIGKMRVPNRIVMTAMGNHMAKADGSVSKADIAFYGARAKGGAGLVITECACVDFEYGKGNLRQLAVDDDKYIPGLKKLAEEIHRHGSVIAVQIYHPGRQGISDINGGLPMLAPSEVECQCVHQPTRAMTKDEIRNMVERFAHGARRLKEAGIDAVEVHGAHGYLINQFLSPYTNKRTDEYGGSFENRMRFLDEIIAAIRKECGKDYPLIVRLSIDEHMYYADLPGEGLHLEDGIAIAKHLENLGVDALDISSGIYETMNTAWEPISFDQGWKIDAPAAVKAEVSIPVIAVSVIREPSYAESILKEGKTDFIGSARLFFADPDWGIKAQEGREKEIRKCISCLYCMETLMEADFSTVPMACAINYQGGRETQYGDEHLKKDGDHRTVVVIGAGPAGMEAARILAMRNFRPVVLERSDRVGGQIFLASKPPKKAKMEWLIDYHKHMLNKLGVEIKRQTAPTLEDIKALNPYAVFVAHGSHPILPKSIPGLEGRNVFTPQDILSGQVELRGKKICVVGSGMTGIETAELLAEQGNEVSVFEMADEIGYSVFFQNFIDVMNHLIPMGVKFYPKHHLIKMEEDKAIFETTDSKETIEYPFEAAIISLGTKPNRELVDELQSIFDKVVLLGDAKQAGRIENAIGSAYKAAFEL